MTRDAAIDTGIEIPGAARALRAVAARAPRGVSESSLEHHQIESGDQWEDGMRRLPTQQHDAVAQVGKAAAGVVKLTNLEARDSVRGGIGVAPGFPSGAICSGVTP